ncbi:MAG: hypothetical protein AB7J35_15135 [Dehalococcoidia bacterium]
MSRINVPASSTHRPATSSRLLFTGLVAGAVAVVAIILIAQPFNGDGSSSSEPATALAPSFSGPVLTGSVAVANAIAVHENGIEAQFGPQSPADLRSAEIARAIAEHENAIEPFVVAVTAKPDELKPETKRALEEHENLIESFVS